MVDIERFGRALAERVVARTLARLPVSPLALTIMGTLLNLGAGVLLALGYLPWAAGLILLGAFCDAADGAVARVKQQGSDIGGFLDSTLDRYSEALVGLGLLLYLLQHGTWMDIVLLYLFVAGSLLFSYTRARAEAAGFVSRNGLFTRAVRILILSFGLLSNLVTIVLWILVVGVHLSALHRLVSVYIEARRRTDP